MMDKATFDARYQQLREHPPAGFTVLQAFFEEGGDHPVDWTDCECAYAAAELAKVRPSHIVDVGSYRHFVWGLSAAYRVTCLDIRPRKLALIDEKTVALDVRQIGSLDESFDAVVSLCTLEHIGLGRYGDEYDIEGDKKAFAEIEKALSPGGSLIFSLPIGPSVILFNAHRIYSYGKIMDFRGGMRVVDEKFFRFGTLQEIPLSEVTGSVNAFDVYCGHWRKE